MAPLIDYAAVRRALCQAVAATSGLPAGKLVQAQAQGPVQPRPPLPYATFAFTSTAIRSGHDATLPRPDLGPTTWAYVGERGMTIDVQFYGRDQDEAYGLAASCQAGIETEPASDLLAAAGLSLWSVGDATDITALLGTGFEARTLLELQVWVPVCQIVDLGQIDTAPVQGVLQDDAGSQLAVDATLCLTDT